jgi:cbb3-type cytochrome oxidase cytochrome c subunit
MPHDSKIHKGSELHGEDVMKVGKATSLAKAESMMNKAGYPKHDFLFTKKQPVGDYVENLLTHRSQGVPESHYKSLVSSTHEDKIVSRGRGGMAQLMGSPIGVVGSDGSRKGTKLPDVQETA